MFAFGFHLNILFIISQLALVRDEIMATSRYAKEKRRNDGDAYNIGLHLVP